MLIVIANVHHIVYFANDLVPHLLTIVLCVRPRGVLLTFSKWDEALDFKRALEQLKVVHEVEIDKVVVNNWVFVYVCLFMCLCVYICACMCVCVSAGVRVLTYPCRSANY